MQPLRSFFPQFSLEDLHQQIKADTGKGPLGRQAAIAVGYGRSIGIRLNDGNFWRFLATEDGIDIDKRIDSAKVIIDADSETWHDLVSEAWSIMGLILQNKVRIEKGKPRSKRFITNAGSSWKKTLVKTCHMNSNSETTQMRWLNP